MPGFRVSSNGPSGCTIAFEPWGGEYRLEGTDYLQIELSSTGGLDDIVHVREDFIQLFFRDEPTNVLNSRGERISV